MINNSVNSEAMMRIGDFSKNNQVGIDTVRHYMSLGLILAQKEKGQYTFDASCQQQMDEIFTLKNMGFTLNEIKRIFHYKRLGNMTNYQKNEYYRLLFKNRYAMVIKEMDKLQDYKINLETEIKALSEHEDEKNFTIGVSFKALSKLRCLKCQSTLILSEGTIVDNQIIEGHLTCGCGEKYNIHKGIVMMSEGIMEVDGPYTQDFIVQYLNTTDEKYLENIYQSIDWVIKKIETEALKDKQILEVGSGVGFMLRNLYHLLPDEALYIAVDHDVNRHIFLKNMLEKADVKKDILLICGDFKELPLEKESIDYVMDYSGTSNYSFGHTHFLLDKIDPYVKREVNLIGTYILFKNFKSNSKIDKKYQNNFSIGYVQEKIKALGYHRIDDKLSGQLDKGGIYEDYFVEGEKVYDYLFYGKRLG